MQLCLFSISKLQTGISSIVRIDSGSLGIIALFSGIISCIVFSWLASLFGIPTSETHGLISGLSGSAVALGNLNNINLGEWGKVALGLVWSTFVSFIIVKIIYLILKQKLYKTDLKLIKRLQKYSSFGLSFMHGAQDGQKFIGLLILYITTINGNLEVSKSPLDNIWIIIFVAIIMFFGVSIGGRKIVENIGENTVKIDNVKGIVSDLGTVISLFLASLFGLPVSTSHVKTISIICLADKNSNWKNVSSVFKAWVWTFPCCFILSYILTKALEVILNLV